MNVVSYFDTKLFFENHPNNIPIFKKLNNSNNNFITQQCSTTYRVITKTFNIYISKQIPKTIIKLIEILEIFTKIFLTNFLRLKQNN